MFGKKGKKTIFDYIENHNPYNSIDDLKRPEYIDGTVSIEHKELESDIEEYWDLLHPLVSDFINSYAISYDKLSTEVGSARESLESARRSLSIEQQNVQDMADSLREIKGELQSEMVMRKDLEERLNDERGMMESQFKQEKRSLEIIAESKLAGGLTLEAVLKEVGKSVVSSEEVARLKTKVDDLENKIKSEREENEKIQGELSTTFMEKMVRYDEMINNLKERLGEE